jgi:hypothetical protein
MNYAPTRRRNGGLAIDVDIQLEDELVALGEGNGTVLVTIGIIEDLVDHAIEARLCDHIRHRG